MPEKNEALRRSIADDLTKLRGFLNAWDPYSLIGSGAPEDEFDSERDRIYAALTSGAVQSEGALAYRIATVFKKSFDDSFTAENCAEAAKSIWNWWQTGRCHGRS